MKRVLVGIGIFLLVLVVVATGALRASLPILEGEQMLMGLTAPVSVSRDDLGIPTVRGRTRRDVARATGFLHAQDRYFQMDLLRRVASGELAALFGAAALDLDQRRRVHGLRRVAKAAVNALPPDDRDLLAAYVEGVNAGIGQLRVSPPEYLLIRSTPEPWRPEDTMLAIHAMFFTLSDGDAKDEMRNGILFECLPDPVAEFLTAYDPEWAAPVDGGTLQGKPIPQSTAFDLRKLKGINFDLQRDIAQSLAFDPDQPAGASNAWVVSGSRTSHGRAIVANDMHLKIALPNIWYRIRLIVAGDTEPALDVSGVSLPGTPAIIAGSNGQVAWSFTNSYGDWSDRVQVRIDPDDATQYVTPDGTKPFQYREERILVHGADDVIFTVRETIWGPVVLDPLQRPTAIRWIAHAPEATNLRLLAFERATTVAEIISIAPHVGIPPQNLTVGDAEGHIGWTIAGRIPRRKNYNSSRPVDGAIENPIWEGWLRAKEYPRIVDPTGGIIWTANHPVVTGPALALIGDSGYWHGARARQIRDGLREVRQASELDMLRIQMDDRALLFARWKTLLLSLLDQPGAITHQRAMEFRQALVNGNDRASTDSVDYRLIWTFRTRLRDVVFSAITAPCRSLIPDYRFEGFRGYEGPLWRLVTEQPAHLLHPDFPNWNVLLANVAQETIEYFATEFEGPFSERNWGEQNILSVRHPLSRAVPALTWLLDLEPTRMSGDRHMPLVMAFDRGASERFAVAPGLENDAYLHMPGGQSGHPFSTYYRAGHDAWVEGRPTPFLPGKTVHELQLIPGTNSE